MATWTDKDLYRIDAELAAKDVAQHARAFHAAMIILGPEFSMGVDADPQFDQIHADYARLFPDSDKAWPGMGVGFAASIDQVRRIAVPVVMGQCYIDVSKGLGFDAHEAFVKWCREDKRIGLKAAFAFADVMDMGYGRHEVSGPPQARETWALAHSQLEMTTNGLVGSFDLSALTQSICMTVELSLKAALMHLGVNEKTLKNLGHNNAKSAKLLASIKPHRDDALIEVLIGRLPPYVGSRYKQANLTRLQMVDLALVSQFIAASTLRRLTSRDFALDIERQEGSEARHRLYD